VSSVVVLAFVEGMALMMLELSGVRALYPLFGSALPIWTTVLGCFMLAMAIGYRLGAHIPHKTMALLLYVSVGVTFLYPFLTLFLKPPLSLFHLFFLSSILSLPAAVLAAFTPFLVDKSNKRAGEAAGFIYSVSTLGIIVSTFLTGSVFLPFLGVVKTLLLSSFFILLLAFALTPNLIIFVVFVLLFLTFFPGFYGIPTLYQSVVLEEKDGLLWLREFKSTVILSALNVSNPSQPVLYYTRVMKEEAEHVGNVKNVLIIGGGGCTQFYHFHSLFPNANITIVDLDPKMLELCSSYFLNFTKDTPTLINEDGRIFLSSTTKRYDIIVLDAFGNACSIPEQLITFEFFSLVKAHLSSHGVVLFNVIGHSNLAPIFYTFSAVFPGAYIKPVEHSLNFIVVGKVNNLSKQVDERWLITDDHNPFEPVLGLCV